MSATIFVSTTRFGWPSAFALCHCSRWVLLAGAANAQGPVCVQSHCGQESLPSLREVGEPRELRNYLESWKNNAESPKMRHPCSAAIKNSLVKAWQITGITGKPAGTWLELYGAMLAGPRRAMGRGTNSPRCQKSAPGHGGSIPEFKHPRSEVFHVPPSFTWNAGKIN